MSSSSATSDADWGCEHFDVPSLTSGNVRACKVSVTDIGKLAQELTKTVVDTSWMTSLDRGARRAYQKAAEETATVLANIFRAATTSGSATTIQEEFGELMVSMGAARALHRIFRHCEVPIAELWKPQVKQNEGFDFHTVCEHPYINFGEAKYSAMKSPHGAAISQISGFLAAEKHFRDRPHLVNLVSQSALQNLDNEEFGVVAAFSLNAVNRPDFPGGSFL